MSLCLYHLYREQQQKRALSNKWATLMSRKAEKWERRREAGTAEKQESKQILNLIKKN
jgi:hypothetical protein